MPANYVLLEKITVGAAGAANVTFSNIPQTGYTDLVMKMSTRSAAAVSASALAMGMTINGVGTNRTYKRLEAYDGTNVASDSGSTDFSAVVQGDASTASTFNNVEIYFPNYTSSNNKSFSVDGVNENNSTTGNDIYFFAGLWSQTAAITSLGFYDKGSSSNFLANSTFYLYGVAKLGTTPAIVPYATGGDTIMTDGTYWYHTFLSSGTFTPQKAISCDYLVVAGGGGGGSPGGTGGGGGGAGGYRTSIGGSPLSLGTSAVTVTVGAGGAGTVAAPTSGSNSVFSSITSTGGGAGAVRDQVNALTGGSGGGGAAYANITGASGNTPSVSPSQGNNGGSGISLNINASGGGGGAGAVGGNGAGSTAGAGGNGLSNSISGSSVTYAGGGGGGAETGTGGAGGTGGGGAGTSNGATPGNGTANLGGGGGARGGGVSANPGGNGGSGIVIVRYAV
jgi:hypothetical protein